MNQDAYSYYEILKRRAQGRTLPLAGKNADGENFILSEGRDENGRHFYRVETAQNNGWCAITTFYEDGDTEETYKKSNI